MTIRRRAFAALLALLPVASWGSAGEARDCQAPEVRQNPGAPLPPIAPKELAARVREARDAYDDRGTFEATFDEVRDTNGKFARNEGKPEDQRPILVIYRGVVRFTSDGLRWRAEYDGKRPNDESARLTPEHWISGYDGALSYDWLVDRNRVILHETHAEPSAWATRSLFWDRSDQWLGLLEGGGLPVAIRSEAVEGQPCYVVEIGKAGEGGARIVIAPGQGYLPIRRTEQAGGKVQSTYDLHDVRQVAPNIWSAGRIEYERMSVRKDGTTRPFIRRSIRVVEFRPGRPVNPASLAFEVPSGVTLVDPRAGLVYFNDPWWPEVGALLLSRFDWPRTDLAPLGKLAQVDEAPLVNKRPPTVRIAAWVRARFPHFTALTGKVVLMVFDDGTTESRLALAPALKRLHTAYGPAGLEILVIEPPGADLEELRRAAEAYEINYSLCVDEAGPGGVGKTAAAYRVKAMPVAVVVNDAGKVHAREGRPLTETLFTLLTEAGGLNELRPLALGSPRIPPEAPPAALKLFQQEVGRALAADPQGEIACQVMDSRGQPVAGARVTARLRLTILTTSGWNATTTYDYSELPGASGPTGPDGRRVIGRLCKGVYWLRITAPGKAWAERKVTLDPRSDSASIEVILADGRTITGRVLDEDGEPVPGATLRADQWEHVEDTTTFTASCEWLGPVQTDADGRFRFIDLPAGRYTFAVSAPGFARQEVQKVAAGKQDVTIKLKQQ